MSLAAVRDIYNPLAIKPEVKPPLQDWKESNAVILLFEYLNIKSQFGIKLCQHDGEPCLIFNPGLKRKQDDPDRWEIAENAAQLFLDAINDLRELIANGKLNLPAHDSHKAAGPSEVSCSTRVAKPH